MPYEVGRSSFKHLARAQIAGKDIGSLKILFHRETKEILGIHVFGERAAEIIHINTTFNYPTMAGGVSAVLPLLTASTVCSK